VTISAGSYKCDLLNTGAESEDLRARNIGPEIASEILTAWCRRYDMQVPLFMTLALRFA